MSVLSQTYLALPASHRSLMTTRPSRTHLHAAFAAISFLTMASVFALPIATDPWRPIPGFVPATGAATAIVDLLIACLLLGQARIGRAGLPLRLAGAYVFAAAAILPNILAFPGVIDAAMPDEHAADTVWLWELWHGGFAAAIGWYAWRSAGAVVPAKTGWTLERLTLLAAGPLLVGGAGVIVYLSHPTHAFAPARWSTAEWAAVLGALSGPAVLASNAAAFAGVTLRLRGQTTVHLWLAVSCFASIVDVGLTLAGGDVFSAGWYLGHVAALLTSLLMLNALISEIMGLYAGLARDNQRLELQAQTDALTRLANRRCFDLRIDQEWRRATRDRTELSLLLIDVDYFKQYNDRYGHPAGDACLRRVARAIRDHVWRAADLAARYGGEEFAVLLPVTNLDGALAVAEWIRCAVHALGLPHAASMTGTLTVSVGVASMRASAGGGAAAQLIDAADRALYRAKALGRDRVEYAEDFPQMAAASATR